MTSIMNINDMLLILKLFSYVSFGFCNVQLTLFEIQTLQRYTFSLLNHLFVYWKEGSPSLSVRLGTRRKVSRMAGIICSYMCSTSRQWSEKLVSFCSSQYRNTSASLSRVTPGPSQFFRWLRHHSAPCILSHCLCNSITSVRTTCTHMHMEGVKSSFTHVQ